jgi:hypothetical protein
MKQRVEWAVARTKLKRDIYSELSNYCKKEDTTISEYIRELVESNISGVVPINQSGQNKIDYNKLEDTFTWKIQFDNGPEETIATHLQPEFLNQLKKIIESSLELRDIYMKKNKESSVPAPTKMKRLKGVRKNA